MVRPTSGVKAEEGPEEVTKIEVALGVAEELIRKKRAYGTELEENAVNLVYGFVTLQDNFDIGGFSVKRQAALNALVACCPRKVAPAIIGEFFKNQYSTDQRFVMLSALALGARELASFPMPPSTVQAQRIAFPSKRLPPALHNKYLAAGDQPRTANPVQNLLEGISREAIDKSKEAAADKVPELVRERQLRIKRPTKISEVTSSSTGSLNRTMESMQLRPQPVVAFTEVAAEYFICPLVNRFWLFLRDEQSREARTAYQPAMHRYRGAGTGLILNALVLSQFLATLAVLVHTARNAKEWLAIIAPEALELAVTLGTQPVSQDEGLNEDEDEDEQNPERRAQKEAAVLTSSLELALIVVDGCLDLDGGRSICLEHTALLLGAGEWGTEVLTRIEKGAKVLGGGGIHEMKLSRAAAGLVLKIDELTSRWRRSMVDIGL
ncbi:hypothetical protein EW026_g4264 [Hermanssonia centrifuga]|uniref:Telomere length regulation protein conserved domain-containing protein n=1 Tax=Hermanssonia centrifuga TaxID=98765 RepID=A0A4S4KHM3_9APHY|nr:hypothetical protein EW026_g4264 [Hermanssonia centrifuga]